MWSVRKLLGLFFVLGLLAGCGSSGTSQTMETPPLAVLGGGTVRITSNKFTPPGYPWNIIVVVAQAPSPSQVAIPNVVIEGDPAAQSETPPGPTGQVILTGGIVHSGYADGNFLVEARPSKECGTELCADLDAKALASVKVSKPGYFSLIMNKTDATVFVVATYSHPTDGTSTREQNLGVVTDRVNGIVLDFSPEPAPAEQPTLSPEDAEALGNLFEQAQQAQESVNDMIQGAIGNIF